mgnify:CR=1 FL=1
MTPFMQSTIRWFSETGVDPAEMQWFDMSGTMDGSSTPQHWLREYRPPFEKCVVVWKGQSKTNESFEFVMTVVGTDPEKGIVLTGYKGPSNQDKRKVPQMTYVLYQDMVNYGPVNENEFLDEKDGQVMLAVVANWYRLLAEGCSAYKPYVKQTFTNRRKMAQGKAPSYDWTTVYIEPPKPRSEAAGGTHASPRLHDRRGHLRKLKSGRNVWVKPCKVGDATKGAVWHDYAIKEVA